MTELQIYRITDLQKDRQGKSSIAPLLQSGAIIIFQLLPFSCLRDQNWPYLKIKGQDLHTLCSTTDPDAIYQVSRQLAQCVLEKKIFQSLEHFFYHDGYLGHVTLTIITLFHPILASFEIHFHLALLVLKKWSPNFYQNF